jgi:hypothetical protein
MPSFWTNSISCFDSASFRPTFNASQTQIEHRLFILDDRKVNRLRAGGLSAPSKKIKSNHEPLALEKAKAAAKEPCSSTYGLHIKT